MDKQQIAENIREVLADLDGRTRLLAATKSVPAEIINFAAEQGIDLIGENRVNELLDKYDEIDKSKVEIHFIGHLQTNKVKMLVDKVSMIHSVDSLRLAAEIDRRCQQIDKVMDILIQVNIAGEATKSGVPFEDALPLVRKIANFQSIRVRGLMAIPPKSENSQENAVFFMKLKQLFIDISAEKVDNVIMDTISAGMSNDYMVAVCNGATIIRVGSKIFGARK